MNLSKEEFIKKCSELHGNSYDYSKIDYSSKYKKTTIICKKHGEFQQTLYNHYIGKKCPKCKLDILRKKHSFSNNEFIDRARKKHGNVFDYSKVDYFNIDTNVTIVCKKHGEFQQTPYNHLNSKYGCRKCGKRKSSLNNRKSSNHYLSNIREKHGDKYEYEFKQGEPLNHEKVKIKCEKHGSFYQTPYNHIQGNGCPNCRIFKLENFIEDILKRNNIQYEKHNREILKPKELDFYIESKKIAIECNGIYWHSEKNGINKYYHLDKLDKCNKKDIRLVQILENEILNKPKIVKSRLESILNLKKYKIYARKCKIKIITKKQKKFFLNKYHIQGNSPSLIDVGLFLKNRIVSVMTFSKPRISLGQKLTKENVYELNRFCNNFNFSVVGGASKLLSYFEREYKPTRIISYADRRWSDGNLYKKIGFKVYNISSPNYWYFTNQKTDKMKLYHRFSFRKQELSKKIENFNENLSEWENMKNNNWNRIWDCGNLCFQKIL